MEEFITPKGHITFVLKDNDGNVKDVREIHNIITTAGKTYLAAWLAAASQAGKFMQYIAVGTGSNGPNASDTTLAAEIAGSRTAGTLTSALNVWTNTVTLGAGVGTGAITEAGMFSASSSGTMFAEQDFSVINKGASDSLQITWNVTLS